MAWIEFHPDELLELQKFEEFRRELDWSQNEAIGFLGVFWGKVLKLRESGDISGWKPEYIVRLTKATTSPERLWKAMVGRWVDQWWVDGVELVLVHDWLDTAGRYLERRYGRSKPEELARIRALHAMVGAAAGAPAASDGQEGQRRFSGATAEPPNRTNQTKPPTPLARCNNGAARGAGCEDVDKPVDGGNGGHDENDAKNPTRALRGLGLRPATPGAARETEIQREKRLLNYRMRFGEYKGVAMMNIPLDRVRWLLHEWPDRGIIDQYTKEALEFRLADKAAERRA